MLGATVSSQSRSQAAEIALQIVALNGDGRDRRERHRIAKLRAREALDGALLSLGESQTLTLGKRADGAPFFLDRPDLAISLSHSPTWAAAAVTRHATIGIDVERIVDSRDRGALASVVLDQGTELPQCLNPAAASRALHLCWSLREAIGKASGGGLWAGRAALRLRCDARHGLPVAWTAIDPRATPWWLAWDWLGADGVLALAVQADADPWLGCELPSGLRLKRLEQA